MRRFTAGGALAALLVGAAVLLAGGWGLALTLVGAVASTAVLTRYRRSEKIQPEHRRGRSASQVLANGIVPATVAIAGALFDLSWALPAAVGATAQARYRCPACGEEGEVEACTCGAVRRLVGGWRWMTNDTVNVLGTLTGAMVAMGTSIPR